MNELIPNIVVAAKLIQINQIILFVNDFLPNNDYHICE